MKYAHYITFLTTKRYHQKAIESEFSTLEYNDFKNIAEEFGGDWIIINHSVFSKK